MKQSVAKRATILGEYIKQNGATVRHTAGVFNISKSTVHTVVTITNGLCGWWHNHRKNRINKGFSARHSAVLFLCFENIYYK